jgi:hypothetical protein
MGEYSSELTTIKTGLQTKNGSLAKRKSLFFDACRLLSRCVAHLVATARAARFSRI